MFVEYKDLKSTTPVLKRIAAFFDIGPIPGKINETLGKGLVPNYEVRLCTA